jgi:chemotaxis protein methyltransferase CheR
VTDGSFCESHLILCRNVLIYFQRELQERVLRLLSNSLRSGGYLCLGSKETLQLSTLRATYCDEDAACKIYRKATSASASRVG